MMKHLLLLLFLMGVLISTPASDVRIAAPAGDGDVAVKLSMLTSLSISPILVGGVRSAMLYRNATEAQRRQLPWNASPWYWGPLLALGLFFFLNSVAATFLPLHGKIVEASRNIEGKLSLIYASPLFLAAGTELFGSLERAGIGLSPISNAAAAGVIVSPAPVDAVFGGLLGFIVFGVIWLSNQAVHAIVLLSPSTLLGMLVRVLQLLLLGGLLLATAVSPMLGAALSLLLIAASAWLAGWSFRLSVFGTVFAWDLLTLRREQPVGDSVLAFSSAALPLPARTLGRLTSRGGQLALAYRPWLIGPGRVMPLPAGVRILSHGVFYTQLLRVGARGEKSMLALPPRYRGSEEALAAFVACTARPSPLKGGLNSALAWLRSLRQAAG